MKPLVIYRGEETEQNRTIYACVHWKSFPPPYAWSGQSPDALRGDKQIKESDYHRMLTWQRICNLMRMHKDKCLTCPHVRIAEYKDGLPVLTTLDGEHSVPAVDLPTVTLNINRSIRIRQTTK